MAARPVRRRMERASSVRSRKMCAGHARPVRAGLPRARCAARERGTRRARGSIGMSAPSRWRVDGRSGAGSRTAGRVRAQNRQRLRTDRRDVRRWRRCGPRRRRPHDLAARHQRAAHPAVKTTGMPSRASSQREPRVAGTGRTAPPTPAPPRPRRCGHAGAVPCPGRERPGVAVRDTRAPETGRGRRRTDRAADRHVLSWIRCARSRAWRDVARRRSPAMRGPSSATARQSPGEGHGVGRVRARRALAR